MACISSSLLVQFACVFFLLFQDSRSKIGFYQVFPKHTFEIKIVSLIPGDVSRLGRV